MVTRMSKLMKAIITWAMSQDETRLLRTELVSHVVDDGVSKKEKHQTSISVGRALKTLKQRDYVDLYGSDGEEDPVTIKAFELTSSGRAVLGKKPCFGVLFDKTDKFCKECRDRKTCRE